MMFQYIKIESHRNRYFCLEQNLAVLVWVIFFHHTLLRQIVREETPKSYFVFIKKWLGKHWKIIRQNFVILMKFTVHKYCRQKKYPDLKLPFYGQICVPVHQGIKVFDIRRGVVVKVFNSDVTNAAINNEIEGLKRVSKIDFAPSLKRWNVKERWFEENFYYGSLDSSYKPMDSETVKTKFCQELVPYIQTIMFLEPPKSKNVLEHIERDLGIFRSEWNLQKSVHKQ